MIYRGKERPDLVPCALCGKPVAARPDAPPELTAHRGCAERAANGGTMPCPRCGWLIYRKDDPRYVGHFCPPPLSEEEKRRMAENRVWREKREAARQAALDAREREAGMGWGE